MTSTNTKKIKTYVPAAEQLREKSAHLISGFLKRKTPDFMKQHAQILDDYFFESFESSMSAPKWGWKRIPMPSLHWGDMVAENSLFIRMWIFLFLFEKYVPDKAEYLIQEIVYPLWDIGFEVGHATRSLKECVKLAVDDIEVLTSLLDARFVCGMSSVVFVFDGTSSQTV